MYKESDLGGGSDMKVGSDRSVVNLEAYVKNAQNSGGVKQPLTQGQDKYTQTESVKLSTTAKEIQQARKAMEAVPEIREDKVGQFKGEIEAGTYSVEGDKVAPKMIKESLIDTFI